MKKRFTISIGLSLGLISVASLVLASASSGEMTKLVLNPEARRPRVVGPNRKSKQVDIPVLQTPALLAGQSATLLPDGRRLLIGGEAKDGGPLSMAVIVDSRTHASSPLPAGLHRPRAWHSTTMLPNGNVLIIGGIGSGGRIIEDVEVFNLEAQKFVMLPSTGITARAYHTATLLTDGRVLVAGGVSSKGRMPGEVEMWNPQTGAASTLPAGLQTARRKQTATLLANGEVLFWGGVDKDENKLDDGEVYDPETGSFNWIGFSSRGEDPNAPYLVASSPKEGETSVGTDARIALRFSKLLSVESVNPQTMRLAGPQGAVAASVIPAENGRLAFITPKEELRPGTTYTLSLSGSIDRGNLQLAPASVTFTTAGSSGDSSERKHESASDQQQMSGNAQLDDDSWVPDTKSLQGDWRSRRADSPARSLPALQAASGGTALAGQVLGLSGRPIANVTLQVEDKTAVTDQTGRFLLTSLKPGQFGLVIRGDTASRPGKTYGTFEVRVDVDGGKTNVLPYTIWLPVLDEQHATRLSTPTAREVIVSTPLIPGMEVRVPSGSVLRMPPGHGMSLMQGNMSHLMTSLAITPIPIDRPPFPLPPGVDKGLFFTLQMHGAKVEGLNGEKRPGIRIVYPNVLGLLPGTRVDFYNYDSTGVGWYLYGQGTVTDDGRQVVPDKGVELNAMYCNVLMGGPSVPGDAPRPGSGTSDGDPVDLATGLFVYQKTDLVLPDVMPISLTRTYRQNDGVTRAFGIGATHPYNMYIVGDTSYTGNMVLPDGSRILFNKLGPPACSTCLYEHTATPSRFYKATLQQVASPAGGFDGGWDVKLLDGTTYHFYRKTLYGDILGIHASVTGLYSIEDRYGNKVIIERDSSLRPVKISSPNGRWIQLSYDGTSERITQAKDNIGRVVTYTYDADGRLWKVTDANFGVTEYGYDAAARMTTIKDARSILYLTNEYDANGRVKKQTQADQTTYQFAYTLDTDNKVTQTDVTDPRSNVRRVTFNQSGYTLTDTAALGKPEQQTATFERETGNNKILSLTDPLGRKTVYSYYPTGSVKDITRMAGTTAAATTSFTYDSRFEQVKTITDPLTHTTTYGYDDKGNLTTATDPLNHTTTFGYNAQGQLTSVTDHLQHVAQFIYDSGDLVEARDPLGHSITRFVDGGGRITRLTDPLGRTTRYEYDGLNLLKKVVDPLQGETSFSYDENGNLKSVTDARGKVTGYTYDVMDRVETRTDPLLKVERYGYDEAGNLKKFTDRRNKVTSFRYDNLNRGSFVGFGTVGEGEAATYESTISYSYDGVWRLTQAVDSSSGTITRSYNDLARTASETTAQGVISYGYDAAGRQTSMSVAGQPAVSYGYDNANRLTSITQGATVVGFGYDEVNRRTSLTLPNGVAVIYGYDAASHLTSLSYKRGATVLGDVSYEYDAAGRRVKMGGSYARTSLPSALTTTTYNDGNRLTQRGANTLTYDENGI